MRFYSKPILRIMGVYAIFVLVGVPLGLAMFAFDRTVVQQSDALLYAVVCLGLMIIGLVIVCKFVLKKCFATLFVSDDKVCWKCPLHKTIILSHSECNYIGVQAEESYKTVSHSFIYLSNIPYPSEYIGKINKLPCSKGFVKFFYSEELSNCLLSQFPDNKTGALLIYKRRRA